MSIRSAANSNLTLNNLVINGTLTLAQPLTYDDFEVDNLDVTGATQLNDLIVSGDTSLKDLSVSGDTILNTLVIGGNISANSEIITPVELGYVSGLTSNLQAQLNDKADLDSPSFSGTVVMPTTQSSGYTYFHNVSPTLPSLTASNYFGAIGANMTGGWGELDFINLGYQETYTDRSAFDWYMMTSATTEALLMRLYHNGELWVSGVLNAVGGVTTSTLTATGHSQLADVASNTLTVTGDLHVSGNIYGATQDNMEIISFHLTGNASSTSEAATLLHNTTGTTNYMVFPSFYYGYTGSSGTYNATSSSGALNPIIIENRTSSSFHWTLEKATSDNMNVYVTFLVVYGVSTAGFPSSWS